MRIKIGLLTYRPCARSAVLSSPSLEFSLLNSSVSLASWFSLLIVPVFLKQEAGQSTSSNQRSISWSISYLVGFIASVLEVHGIIDYHKIPSESQTLRKFQPESSGASVSNLSNEHFHRMLVSQSLSFMAFAKYHFHINGSGICVNEKRGRSRSYGISLYPFSSFSTGSARFCGQLLTPRLLTPSMS